MNITSTFFHRLGELVDKIKPDLKDRVRALSVQQDRFEAPHFLSTSEAQASLASAEKNAARTETLILSTLSPLDSQTNAAAQASNLRILVRDIQKQISVLREMHEDGNAIPSEQMRSIALALSKCEISARQLQTTHIADSLRLCLPAVRAKIETLSVLLALEKGDHEFTKTILKAHPLRNARRPLKRDFQILRRFDSKFLNRFAEMGLVIKIDYDLFQGLQEDFKVEISELESAHQEVTQHCRELENEIQANDRTQGEKCDIFTLLRVKESARQHIEEQIASVKGEERELQEGYYLRDHYYLVEDKYLGMFQHLCVLLDDAQIAIASSRNIEFKLMESLFRGHFEMFCGFGVIERLSQSELSARALQGLCDVRDFLRVGNAHCRFSTTGLEQLKRAVRLNPAKCPPKPRSVPKLAEPQAAPEQPPRVRDYAIVKLDESAEFY